MKHSTISTVKSKLPKNLVRARLCEQSFFYFLKEFWGVIIHEEPIYNWHIEYQCGVAEEIIDRIIRREDKIFDTIINIPPGTSKSTIWSVMLPVWAWIKDSSIRVLTASHTASLSINLALLSRDIIKSEKFKDYFPEIVLKSDQDNKSHYKNTSGGERYATSVGSTPTGFHAHIILCLPYDVEIMTDIGSVKIGDIVENEINCKVLSYNHSTKLNEYKEILKYEKNPFRTLVKVTTKQGKVIECTEDHLIYTHNRGYVMAKNLKENDELESL